MFYLLVFVAVGLLLLTGLLVRIYFSSAFGTESAGREEAGREREGGKKEGRKSGREGGKKGRREAQMMALGPMVEP